VAEGLAVIDEGAFAVQSCPGGLVGCDAERGYPGGASSPGPRMGEESVTDMFDASEPDFSLPGDPGVPAAAPAPAPELAAEASEEPAYTPDEGLTAVAEQVLSMGQRTLDQIEEFRGAAAGYGLEDAFEDYQSGEDAALIADRLLELGMPQAHQNFVSMWVADEADSESMTAQEYQVQRWQMGELARLRAEAQEAEENGRRLAEREEQDRQAKQEALTEFWKEAPHLDSLGPSIAAATDMLIQAGWVPVGKENTRAGLDQAHGIATEQHRATKLARVQAEADATWHIHDAGWLGTQVPQPKPFYELVSQNYDAAKATPYEPGTVSRARSERETIAAWDAADAPFRDGWNISGDGQSLSDAKKNGLASGAFADWTAPSDDGWGDAPARTPFNRRFD
jgi:hypothetical protein